ncbi:hypothetical protein HK102_000077 [Quaeritorhiza haematococci]|nr:hypothetical protein HK102_000077 [Quaeritorhiza haematococci]
MPEISSRSTSPTPANYKTVLCEYFAKGDCSRGRRCTFAHGKAELLPPPPPRSTTTSRSTSKGQAGSNANPLKLKTKLCRRWKEGGTCSFGEGCWFAHGVSELREESDNEVQAAMSSQEESEPSAEPVRPLVMMCRPDVSPGGVMSTAGMIHASTSPHQQLQQQQQRERRMTVQWGNDAAGPDVPTRINSGLPQYRNNHQRLYSAPPTMCEVSPPLTQESTQQGFSGLHRRNRTWTGDLDRLGQPDPTRRAGVQYADVAKGRVHPSLDRSGSISRPDGPTLHPDHTDGVSADLDTLITYNLIPVKDVVLLTRSMGYEPRQVLEAIQCIQTENQNRTRNYGVGVGRNPCDDDDGGLDVFTILDKLAQLETEKRRRREEEQRQQQRRIGMLPPFQGVWQQRDLTLRTGIDVNPANTAGISLNQPQVTPLDDYGCVVCFDSDDDEDSSKPRAVLVPCGHASLCFPCANDIRSHNMKCPFCRESVKQVIKLYA